MPIENADMWTNAEVMWIYHGDTNVSPMDLAVNIASSGYYE